MADTASSTDPAKASTKSDGKPTSSKVGNYNWEIVTFLVNYFVDNSSASGVGLGEAITVVPIFYKFSLLQAAAATVNSDESTSKRGRSKVKNPSKFPKLQLLKPRITTNFVSSTVSLAAELKKMYIVLFIRLFRIFSPSGG